jgi:TRAP-type mannitol/chloroaromatic compound transport system substrate-binding protein
MSRRSFLAQAATGTLAAAAAPAVIAQSGPKLRWRMTSSFPKSLDALYGAGELIARQVAAATGGNFEIRTYAAGEIVPAFGVVDAVQNNTVEMGFTAGYYFVGKDPCFAFDAAMPFGLNSRQQTAWMIQGGGGELMADFFRGHNIHALPAGNTGAQMGGWYRKEFKSVEDLQGLKMRIAGLAGTVLSKLGVVAQQIPASDIYPSLEKGTIDAAEWVGPYDDEKLGLYKVAKYYYYPAFWEGCAQLSLYINATQWDALPAEYKAIIEGACAQSLLWSTARYDTLNPVALKRLVANGTQLRRFPQPVLAAAHKASEEMYADISAKNPAFKKIFDNWSRFRGQEVEWFRVAEDGYDNYVGQLLR